MRTRRTAGGGQQGRPANTGSNGSKPERPDQLTVSGAATKTFWQPCERPLTKKPTAQSSFMSGKALSGFNGNGAAEPRRNGHVSARFAILCDYGRTTASRSITTPSLVIRARGLHHAPYNYAAESDSRRMTFYIMPYKQFIYFVDYLDCRIKH